MGSMSQRSTILIRLMTALLHQEGAPAFFAPDQPLDIIPADRRRRATENFARLLGLSQGHFVPALPTSGTLSDWAHQWVPALDELTLSLPDAGQTDGSYTWDHDILRFNEDAACLAAIVSGSTRIVTLAPLRTGLALTACTTLPDITGLPVITLPSGPAETILTALREGDALVATPTQWQDIAQLNQPLPRNMQGLMGYGTASTPLSADLSDLGLDGLAEVCGTSSMLGFGARTDRTAPFTLWPHWRHLDDGRLGYCGAAANLDTEHWPDDLLIWDPAGFGDHDGSRHFRPAGRRDSAIVIGETPVSPARIASVLCDHESVARCSVRLSQDKNPGCLRAHIELKPGFHPSEKLVRAIERWSRVHLSPEERPRLFSFDVTEVDDKPELQAFVA